MSKQAVIYTRISRDSAHDELGVRRQQKDCEALCERLGIEVVAVCSDDDRSAYSGKPRPGYDEALRLIADGKVTVLVAWHPDRITRHPRELEDLIDTLEANKCSVSTVQAGDYDLATPTGRMVARVVGATARHESEHKSARLRRKHREIAENGQVSGGGTRPFGFEDDRITHRPTEAAAIRDMAAQALAGMSLRRIVVGLNEADITPVKKGASWTPMVVRRLLMSARIAGLRDHQGKVYPAVWAPIVSADDHRRLRALFADPARNRARPGARRYLLTGMSVCGLCGTKLVARPRSDGRRSIVCATGPGFYGCGKIRSLAEPVDALVTDAVLERLDGLDIDRYRDQGQDSDAAVITELELIEMRIVELAEMWASGEMSRAAFTAATAALEARRGELEGELARPKGNVLQRLDGDVRARWSTLDIDAQRAIIAAVVESVVLAPAVKGRNTFDPSRVSINWRV